MKILCIFFGILFTSCGILFAIGKIHPRLTAWKNMPDEEKDKINIKALARNIGEMIMLCGIIFLLSGLIEKFEGRSFVIAMIAWMCVAGFDVWYISKSNRFKNIK